MWYNGVAFKWNQLESIWSILDIEKKKEWEKRHSSNISVKIDELILFLELHWRCSIGMQSKKDEKKPVNEKKSIKLKWISLLKRKAGSKSKLVSDSINLISHRKKMHWASVTHDAVPIDARHSANKRRKWWIFFSLIFSLLIHVCHP